MTLSAGIVGLNSPIRKYQFAQIGVNQIISFLPAMYIKNILWERDRPYVCVPDQCESETIIILNK